jgi:4-hydroxy-tetrahydrodipicolinate synthase
MRKVPAGVWPVLATPFTENGDLDSAALANEVEFVIGHRADGVVLGMVSEVLRLSSEERDALAEAVCRAARGRVGVITSVGAESLHTAVRHAKHAEAAGAAAVMAIPPLGTPCDDEELFRYYAAIIESVQVPVVVQDASGYLGRPLSIELQAHLFAAYGDRALFKPEAPPIGPRLTRLLQATGGKAKVFEGTGGLALVDSYRRGIAGTMPGPDLPWALVALWHALQAGDDDRAYQIHGAAVRAGLGADQPRLLRRRPEAPAAPPGGHPRHLLSRARRLPTRPGDRTRGEPPVRPNSQRGERRGIALSGSVVTVGFRRHDEAGFEAALTPPERVAVHALDQRKRVPGHHDRRPSG